MKTRNYEVNKSLIANAVNNCDYFDIYFQDTNRWLFVFYEKSELDDTAHMISSIDLVPSRLMRAYRHHVKLSLFDQLPL